MTEAAFTETSAEPRTEQVPYAHLSIELGHLYMEDYEAGIDGLREHFRRVAPWARAAHQVYADTSGVRTVRVSTCFLVDDYFGPFGSPRTIVPELVQAAEEAGLHIDYLARESGCATADGVDLARLVESRLVPEPTPRTTGFRPPVTDTGWLCNGQRSPAAGTSEAMGEVLAWRPPAENAANRHSIFLDVELWDEKNGRTWSCPFLASVWQLLRLGMLRHFGRRVAVPQPWPDEPPEGWHELPAVTRLSDSAAPFCAYRTFSVLATRFLPIEHAVRNILSQVTVEEPVAKQALERSGAEGVYLPPELVDRVEYAFINPGALSP
ncbi:MAG: hypothetical protein AUI14_03795 [Actinobacteria bacterium 13_2_20CM_2_71_6]|nr:MAG: hypothetical protein AUI14_03795 [Actinobacteria bacterium 13_2_20CM_2_71_6]